VDAFLEAEDADELRGALDALASVVVEDADADATEVVSLGHDGDDVAGSRRKYLRPNRTHFTSADGSKRFLFGKPHIFECDMHDDETLSETQSDDNYSLLWSFFDATSDAMSLAFASAVPELRLAPAGTDVSHGEATVERGIGWVFSLALRQSWGAVEASVDVHSLSQSRLEARGRRGAEVATVLRRGGHRGAET
jgi:hypothetical protein